jgi:ankyrin repeat protein
MFETIDEVGIIAPARQHLRDYFTETAQTLIDPFIRLYRLPLDELRALLKQDPALATASNMGRTLLGEAVSRWDLPRVQLLLAHGANANAENRLEHGPLYRATNALVPGLEAEGRAVVELLLRYGADVNWPSGPGLSTPLHMTARRDNVSLAEVLLNAGAEIDRKDSKGETPLRRAVNCGQEGMVILLLSRGADPLSQDKQGRTPLGVARQERIRQALQQVTKC